MKLRMKVFAAVALAISLVIAYLIVEEVSTRKTVNLYRPTSAREKLMAELSSLDPSQYGGYYLSDNATKLHINVLSTRNLPIAISGVDNVEIHTVKYSLKQLQDLEETVSLLLQERHEEFNLKGYGVNQTDNKFSVSVVGPPDMDTSELQKLLDAYAMDADMYEIKIEKEHAVLHTGHVDQRKERLRLGAFTRDGAAVVFSNVGVSCSLTCGVSELSQEPRPFVDPRTGGDICGGRNDPLFRRGFHIAHPVEFFFG